MPRSCVHLSGRPLKSSSHFTISSQDQSTQSGAEAHQALSRRDLLRAGAVAVLGSAVVTSRSSFAAARPSGSDPAKIILSPPLFVGNTQAERAAFLRRARVMEVKTVSMATPANWSDDEVAAAGVFLREHGMRVGEFSAFHSGLASADDNEHQEAMRHYRRQLRHAKIIGAHCVGFALLCGRIWKQEFSKTFLERGAGTPKMWSRTTWNRCMATVKQLAREAEQVGIDIAAHPHLITPVNSVQRYKEMLDGVGSSRLKVLLDPVNLTWPHMVYHTTELVSEMFDELGGAITALHAKDITISGSESNDEGLSVVHADEAVPGTGHMDYATILRRLNQLDHTVTVHVEHFSPQNTLAGQQFLRYLAWEQGIRLG